MFVFNNEIDAAFDYASWFRKVMDYAIKRQQLQNWALADSNGYTIVDGPNLLPGYSPNVDTGRLTPPDDNSGYTNQFSEYDINSLNPNYRNHDLTTSDSFESTHEATVTYSSARDGNYRVTINFSPIHLGDYLVEKGFTPVDLNSDGDELKSNIKRYSGYFDPNKHIDWDSTKPNSGGPVFQDFLKFGFLERFNELPREELNTNKPLTGLFRLFNSDRTESHLELFLVPLEKFDQFGKKHIVLSPPPKSYFFGDDQELADRVDNIDIISKLDRIGLMEVGVRPNVKSKEANFLFRHHGVMILKYRSDNEGVIILKDRSVPIVFNQLKDDPSGRNANNYLEPYFEIDNVDAVISALNETTIPSNIYELNDGDVVPTGVRFIVNENVTDIGDTPFGGKTTPTWVYSFEGSVFDKVKNIGRGPDNVTKIPSTERINLPAIETFKSNNGSTILGNVGVMSTKSLKQLAIILEGYSYRLRLEETPAVTFKPTVMSIDRLEIDNHINSVRGIDYDKHGFITFKEGESPVTSDLYFTAEEWEELSSLRSTEGDFILQHDEEKAYLSYNLLRHADYLKLPKNGKLIGTPFSGIGFGGAEQGNRRKMLHPISYLDVSTGITIDQPLEDRSYKTFNNTIINAVKLPPHASDLTESDIKPFDLSKHHLVNTSIFIVDTMDTAVKYKSDIEAWNSQASGVDETYSTTNIFLYILDQKEEHEREDTYIYENVAKTKNTSVCVPYFQIGNFS